MNSLAAASAIILFVGSSMVLQGATLTAPPLVIFGRVLHVGEGPSYQAYEGTLAMELVRDDDPTHVVSLTAPLSRIGAGGQVSYRIEAPLRHLPDPHELPTCLAVGFQEIGYSVRSLTVDGRPARPVLLSQGQISTLLSRPGGEHRLDIQVTLPQVDSDGDGMPDHWELRYGLNSRLASDANLDLDGDGLSNWQEWINGTDPTVPNFTPVLQTTLIRVPAGGVAGFHVGIVDLDTGADHLRIRLDQIPAGLTVLWQTSPLNEGAELSYRDIVEGGVRIGVSRDFESGTLGLAIRDTPFAAWTTGAVSIVAVSPATAAGVVPASWLDANSLDGAGAVAEWKDLSGNLRDAYQPFPTAQASASGEPLGGVRFSRETYLYLDDRDLTAAGCAVLLAFEPGERRAGPQTVFRVDPFELAIEDGGSSAPFLQWAGADGVVVGPSLAAGRGEQLTLSAGSSATFLRSARGHAVYSVDARRAVVSDPAFPTLGATHWMRHNAASEYFNGVIREFVFYSEQLDPFALTALEDYLQSRWDQLTVWDFREQTLPVAARGYAGTRNAITGGWGRDDLVGGPGSDIMRGGSGDDRLTGLEGADWFQFFRNQGNDVVTDFNPDEGDVLDLTGIFGGLSGQAADYVRLRHVITRTDSAGPRADSIIEVDYDGAANGWTVNQTITLENYAAPPLAQLAADKALWLGGPAWVSPDPEEGGGGLESRFPAMEQGGGLTVRSGAGGLELILVMPATWLESDVVVQRSSNLRDWSDVTSQFPATDAFIGGNLVQRTYMGPAGAPSPSGFYRVLSTPSQP